MDILWQNMDVIVWNIYFPRRFVLFYIQPTASCKILDVKWNTIKIWAKWYQRAAGKIRIRIRKIFSLTNFSESGVITESITMQFRTFSFSIAAKCIIYILTRNYHITKEIRIMLLILDFKTGNGRQSKRLLANMGRILLFFYLFIFFNKTRIGSLF
jgi:hypothetical protein